MKLKELEAISKDNFGYEGQYLTLPDGGVTTIPSTADDQRIVVQNSEGTGYISYANKDIFLQTDVYDEHFTSLKDLSEYLNRHEYTYIGID